jgi:glycosyltransferase involved in cell wall biosynthesis
MNAVLDRSSVAALIPAYQAAPTVGDVVRRTRAQLDHVLVIDDGSTDDGAGEAARAGAEVLAHAVNRGKGAALETGFRALLEGGFQAVVTLDADAQHLPEEIPKLLSGADRGGDGRAGADLVLGTRDHLFAQMSAVRRLSNRISSRLISIAAGAPLSDVQTGFRLYGRRLLEEIGLQGSGFEAETAVVVRAVRQGFRVLAVPVRMGVVDGRGTSHYRPLLDSLRIARAVIRAR